MNEQLTIPFKTKAPINMEKLSGQNGRLYRWLINGNKIHCMHPARYELKIGVMNSRISDLRNDYNIPIEDKYITVPDSEGNPTLVKEYWISEENRKQSKMAA